MVSYNCQRTKTNKNLKEVVIMIMFTVVFFSLVGSVVWFTENTRIGRKWINKLVDNIIKK